MKLSFSLSVAVLLQSAALVASHSDRGADHLKLRLARAFGRAEPRATGDVSCKKTADCPASCERPASSHNFCNRKAGTCSWRCNRRYVKSGDTCVPIAAPDSASQSSDSTTAAAPTTTTTTQAAITTTTTTAPTTTTTTTTSTAPPAASTTAGAQLSLSPLAQAAVDEHTRFRALHGAGPVTWNATLATFAQGVSDTCVFKHSGGPYGENLSAVGGGSPKTIDFMTGWENEASDYNAANPQYSHFTQMVWKATTQIGCALTTCPAGSIFDAKFGESYMFTCEYNPPGNYIGQFAANVQ